MRQRAAYESAETAAMSARFLSSLVCRGYELEAAVPITQGDDTVAFVNANVTPYKDRMVGAEFIWPTGHYQLCLREHGAAPYLYAFGMVGSVESLDGPEALEVAVSNAHYALVEGLPEADPARVVCLVDPSDADLVGALEKVVDAQWFALSAASRGRVASRWEYGANVQLRGRGVTYIYDLLGEAAHDSCGPECACGRWLAFANIIVVEAGSHRYMEVGCGVEMAASAAYQGDLYALPDLGDYLSAGRAAGVPLSELNEFANLCRAIAILADAGVVPSGSRHGSVLRRLVRRLSVIVDSTEVEIPIDAVSDTWRGCDILRIVDDESARRRVSDAGRVQRVLKVLDRRPSMTDDELYGTTGASSEQIAAARRKRKLPPRLRPGGRIAVVSPSLQGLTMFRARGSTGIDEFESRTSTNIVSVEFEAMDTRIERARQFNDALRDPRVDGIIWSIGGTTASEVVDLIDYDAFARRPKVICGYSDATVIHQAIYAVTGCTTFYGPALLPQFGEHGGVADFTMESFRRVLFDGWEGGYEVSDEVIEDFLDWREGGSGVRRSAPARAHRVVREGKGEGPLLPGCLPSICQLIGTEWLPDYSHHLLAIDLPDGDYNMERAAVDLWHMRHAGLFDAVVGIVVGRPRLWSDDARARLSRTLLEVTADLKVPVVTEFEFGHTDPMLTLPLGAQARLESGTLTLLEPAVRQ